MYVLRPEECGRKTPILDGYRPNHFFGELKDGSFMGRIDIPDDGVINLGETRDVWITFIDSPGLAAHLTPGNRWKITEAANPVATAEILKVEK